MSDIIFYNKKTFCIYFNYDRNQFYVCLPTIMAESFVDIMKICEDCDYSFIGDEDVDMDTLSNTHVRELHEINNGKIIKISVILTKDI